MPASGEHVSSILFGDTMVPIKGAQAIADCGSPPVGLSAVPQL